MIGNKWISKTDTNIFSCAKQLWEDVYFPGFALKMLESDKYNLITCSKKYLLLNKNPVNQPNVLFSKTNTLLISNHIKILVLCVHWYKTIMT